MQLRDAWDVLIGTKSARDIVVVHPPVEPVAPPPLSKSVLRDYLEYYISLDEPQYAVLVTGEWGTGKTFQVRQILPKERAYYVSLYGLKNSDEVVAAVYASMFPTLSAIRRTAESVGETSAEVPGIGSLAVTGLAAGIVGAFLRQEVKKDKPIIFDDLERCGLKLEETLGVINLYVEHHGCKVVVIAHDGRLANDFATSKEKIFGQTIKVSPATVDAFHSFENTLGDNSVAKRIAELQAPILTVFDESRATSLRILRHVIDDVARLLRALSVEQLRNKHAVAEAVRLLSALDIEWRDGRCKVTDLERRSDKEFTYYLSKAAKQEGNEQPWIIPAKSRYASVDLTSTLLQDRVLVQMLVEGQFNDSLIQESLNASAYFLKPTEGPTWQLLLNFDTLDDETTEKALQQLGQQLANFEIVDQGIMLHTFAFRMMMANHGIAGESLEAVAESCRTYVDALSLRGLLSPLEYNWDQHDRLDSAYGYAFWVEEPYRALFRETAQYLVNARRKTLRDQLPALGLELLKIMENSGERFFEEVCHTRNGSARFVSVPILAAIDVEVFVSTWLGSSRRGWYWISNALKERYRRRNEENLTDEASWIENVVESLRTHASRADGLAKVRIERTIPHLS